MCPALGNEMVYFNNQGFNHLLKKGRKKRKPSDQYRRFRLMKYLPELIGDPKISVSIRRINSDSGTIHYWELRKKLNSMTISIIVRQVNHGKIHFYSIFSRK